MWNKIFFKDFQSLILEKKKKKREMKKIIKKENGRKGPICY